MRDRLLAGAGWATVPVFLVLALLRGFAIWPADWWVALMALLPCLYWASLAIGRDQEWLLPAFGGVGMGLPLAVMFATLEGFSLVDHWPWFVAGAALAVGALISVAMAFWRMTRPYGASRAPAMAVRLRSWLILLPVSYVALVLVQVNAVAERGPVAILHGRVIDRTLPQGRGAPRLFLAGPPAALGIDAVDVGRGLYDRSPRGASLCVQVHTGWLGLRWYEVGC
jgi:hypothetical protein